MASPSRSAIRRSVRTTSNSSCSTLRGPGLAAGGDGDGVPLALQALGDRLGQVPVVVDDQHAQRVVGADIGRRRVGMSHATVPAASSAAGFGREPVPIPALPYLRPTDARPPEPPMNPPPRSASSLPPSPAALVGVALVASQAPPTGAKMADAANKFLATLTAGAEAEGDLRVRRPAPRRSGSSPRSRTRRRSRPARGVRLEEMTDEQKAAALDLLRAGLSAKGYDQATTIMSLEEILADLEDEGRRWSGTRAGTS